MYTWGSPVYLYPDFVTKFTLSPGMRAEFTQLETNNKTTKIMFVPHTQFNVQTSVKCWLMNTSVMSKTLIMDQFQHIIAACTLYGALKRILTINPIMVFIQAFPFNTSYYENIQITLISNKSFGWFTQSFTEFMF